MIFESEYNARLYSANSCWKARFEDGSFVIEQYAMPKRNIIQKLIAWIKREPPTPSYFVKSISFEPSQIINAEIYIAKKWAKIDLMTTEEEYCLDGLVEKEARRFQDKIIHFVNEYLCKELANPISQSQHMDYAINDFYQQDKYLDRLDAISFFTLCKAALDDVNYMRVEEILSHRLFEEKNKPENLVKWCERLRDLSGARVELHSRNERFVRSEMLQHAKFFDEIEKTPLTQEQRRAAIVMEDRHLLIAAAGSGKTSAIVGKIGYALHKDICNPEQILALAFNNKAAEELKERIRERLENIMRGGEICATTFHAYGLKTIASAQNVKPRLADWTEQDVGVGGGGMSEIIEQAIEEIPEFLSLLTYFRREIKPIHQFNNWLDYKKYLFNVGAEGKQQEGIRTINGEQVRSLEEQIIADYLYSEGVDYRYEGGYEYNTATRDHSQYHPDFSYPAVDGLYHEHFALDEYGNPPIFIGDSYLEGVEWKRNSHKEKGTVLIETTSAMFCDGTIFSHLRKELEKHGIVVGAHRLNRREITKKLKEHILVPLYKLMRIFLKHWKAGGFSEKELFARLENLPTYTRARATVFLRVMTHLRRIYDDKLQSKGEIDFVDMIVKSTEAIKHGKATHNFQLILVDEFQDISRDRALLLQEILAQQPDCKLFAVGDDWQAIYRFTGADISIMTNYSNEFGYAAKDVLTKTFRSNQGISNVAAEFVGQNPEQFKKEVFAKDKIYQQVVQVVYCRDNNVEIIVDARLKELAAQAQYDKKISIYILARYNYLRPKKIAEWNEHFSAMLTIDFLTVHKAKGLEADYVFVLGLCEGVLGFPNGMLDDSVLDLVMPRKEKFEYAEERRLFYVALTRARHKVFLLTNDKTPSRFVSEIIENGRESVEIFSANEDKISEIGRSQICPNCGDGFLLKRSGDYGVFWGCPTYPICDYKAANCPQCDNGFLRKKADNDSNLWQCSSHLLCDYEAAACPECDDGFLIKRKGARGYFWGCSNYFKSICKYTCNISKIEIIM